MAAQSPVESTSARPTRSVRSDRSGERLWPRVDSESPLAVSPHHAERLMRLSPRWRLLTRRFRGVA